MASAEAYHFLSDDETRSLNGSSSRSCATPLQIVATVALCLLLSLTVLAFVVPVANQARSSLSPPYDVDGLQQCLALHPDSVCWYPIQGMHPTQFSVGFEELRCKLSEVNSMSRSEFKTYLNKKRVPVILGPEAVPYMIDRHHTSAIVHLSGRSEEMIVVVEEDWSHLSVDEFWKQMIEKNYCYLWNPEGTMQQAPQFIPDSVSKLINDPYRSLAWYARKCGGFEDTGVPYTEFIWAQYFRQHISPNVLIPDNDYCRIYSYDPDACWLMAEQHEWTKESLGMALNLSYAPGAVNLPGYGEFEGTPEIACPELPAFADWVCPPIPPKTD